MGRPSKLTPVLRVNLDDREAVAKRLISDGVMRAVVDLKNDERAAMAQIKIMLIAGDLRRVLGTPEFHAHRFEFAVATGRIDLLLFHADGGMTIVEIKADSSNVNDIAAGIGQLFMYSIALPAALADRQKPKYIDLILCAPVAPARSLSLMQACMVAGVRFVHLAPYSVLKSHIDALKQKAA